MSEKKVVKKESVKKPFKDSNDNGISPKNNQCLDITPNK